MEKALSEYQVKDIEGYEGVYAITSCGRVYSHSRVNGQGRLQKGRWMKPQVDKDGYLKVRLQLNGTSKYCMVHRLVAMAFLPNPLNHPVINHKNEVKDYNDVSNLEWCTIQYNTEYSRSKKVTLVNPKGELVDVFNVTKFARDNGLDVGHLNKVVAGTRQSHKRWRLAN